jgi:hypothetical protein
MGTFAPYSPNSPFERRLHSYPVKTSLRLLAYQDWVSRQSECVIFPKQLLITINKPRSLTQPLGFDLQVLKQISQPRHSLTQLVMDPHGIPNYCIALALILPSKHEWKVPKLSWGQPSTSTEIPELAETLSVSAKTRCFLGNWLRRLLTASNLWVLEVVQSISCVTTQRLCADTIMCKNQWIAAHFERFISRHGSIYYVHVIPRVSWLRE